MLFRTLTLKAAHLPFVHRTVRESKAFRGLVNRFVAGESSAQALTCAEGLAETGFGVSLDLLGENVSTAAEAESSLTAYQNLVEQIGQSSRKDSINISIKLTALGLDQGDELAEANLRSLLQAAKPHGIFVRVDMEGSAYTERTISMLERVYPDFPNTGTVLQSSLYRTDDDLERLLRLGCRLRLVKGAYLESSAVAYPSKQDVDRQYVLQAMRLLKRGRYPAIATHDEHIIRHLVEFIKEEELDSSLFEWQMLYGIGRELQQELKGDGFNVRVYVPFGDAWYPYFTRRLAERPANIAFIGRSLIKR